MDLLQLVIRNLEALGDREFLIHGGFPLGFLRPTPGQFLLVGPFLGEAILFGLFLHFLTQPDEAADHRAGGATDENTLGGIAAACTEACGNPSGDRTDGRAGSGPARGF